MTMQETIAAFRNEIKVAGLVAHVEQV